MFFWIFMLTMNLMLPLTMLGFGLLFVKKPPGQINAIYGYRTKMSMKNQETWNYAHKVFGRIWYRAGWALLPLTVLLSLPLLGKSEDTIGLAGAGIEFFQCIVLVLPIWQTERELKRKFDADGNRKQGIG